MVFHSFSLCCEKRLNIVLFFSLCVSLESSPCEPERDPLLSGLIRNWWRRNALNNWPFVESLCVSLLWGATDNASTQCQLWTIKVIFSHISRIDEKYPTLTNDDVQKKCQIYHLSSSFFFLILSHSSRLLISLFDAVILTPDRRANSTVNCETYFS